MKLKEFNADLRPHAYSSKLGAHKNILNKLLVGNYTSDLRKTGIEFMDYRPYISSDDASKIDWKATKRSQKLLVKETSEEKAVNVIFVLDVSDSMLCASHKKLKCEYAAEMIANIAFAIQREGNAIGLIMFNDKISVRIPPSIGIDQYHNIIKELKNPNNYGGGCDIKRALRESISVFKIPSLVIILSDFLSVNEGWENYLKIISMKFKVFGILIRDPRDRELPKDAGYFVLEDPSSDKRMIVDTKEYYKRYKEYNVENENKLKQIFKRSKSLILPLSSNEPFMNDLIRFLEKEQKVLAR